MPRRSMRRRWQQRAPPSKDCPRSKRCSGTPSTLSPPATRRGAIAARLAVAVAHNLSQIARDLSAGWGGDGEWRRKMLEPGPQNASYKTPAEPPAEFARVADHRAADDARPPDCAAHRGRRDPGQTAAAAVRAVGLERGLHRRLGRVAAGALRGDGSRRRRAAGQGMDAAMDHHGVQEAGRGRARCGKRGARAKARTPSASGACASCASTWRGSASSSGASLRRLRV